MTAAPDSEPPTATQLLADWHATSPMPFIVAGTSSVTHWVVPFVVATMAGPPVAFSPTATHSLADGQDTPTRSPTPAGSLPVIQSVPASVVEMTAPAEPVWPTAKQSSADGQETSASPVTPEGTFCVCQMTPPFVVATMAGVPTSVFPIPKQSSVDGHTTSLRYPTPIGTTSGVQSVPPSEVVMTVPARTPSADCV